MGGGAAADVLSPALGGTEAVVARHWPESTIVCIGGGPSLTAADVDACRGRALVIAVNDAYRLAPWADVLYACDARWWRWHDGVRGFPGLKYALEADDRRFPDQAGIIVLKNTGDTGLELTPTGLRTGMNSGYQAINLAVHLGARTIVLLGYDLQADPGRPSHWFGEHPSKITPNYRKFRAAFASLVTPLSDLGVAVINASRRTALTCFPCRPLEDVLAATEGPA